MVVKCHSGDTLRITNIKTKAMRQIFLISFLLISVASFGQKIEWIPFNWVGDSISGKYFDKLSVTVPVTIDNLPHKFNMQLDLGATNTVIYGNSIRAYLDEYYELKNKIDTALKFEIQGQINFKFKNVGLKLGSVNFGIRNIGHFKNYGENISKDLINTNTEKHIGTIAPDLFENEILIIDYPNKRICVTNQLPKQFSKANFRPFKIKGGRIKIPLQINGKEEDLMFDTGASLFSLVTTENRAKQISDDKIIDSLKISSWGEYFMVYGKQTIKPIKYGKKVLNQATVFFVEKNEFDKFYEEEQIWGVTGNVYFLNNVIIIDYKNKRFGVK